MITTPGDPTSELLALVIRSDLNGICKTQGVEAAVSRIRVWESPNAYAELKTPDTLSESPMQIADIFVSLQGEGKNQGRPCLFIRLAGLQP